MNICDQCWKPTGPEYIKFNDTNLATLTYPMQPETVAPVLKATIQNYLFGNYSFYTDQNKFNVELLPQLNASCKQLEDVVVAKYSEVQERMKPKQLTRTRDFTQNYGKETSSNSYYEPLKNSTQAVTKTTSQQTEWEPDTTSETVTEDTTLTDSLALKELYDSIPYLVENFFSKYINTLLLGC